MLMAVLGYFPHSVYQAYMCSSGARGYHAFREALEVGRPRHTLLVTNVDIRDIHDGGLMCQPLVSRIYFTHSQSSNRYWTQRIPANCTHLMTIGCIDTTGDCFLAVSLVESIELTGLSNITTIMESFMSYCCQLSSIDLSPLVNVRDIKSGFLNNCSSLTSINLTPLVNLVNVGWSFLSRCTGLTSIDLSPLHRVEEVTLFLNGCTGLTSIDLRPLSNLTTVGMYFLGECTGLTTIDLIPFGKVHTIHRSFMEGCAGLTRLDVSPLHNVTLLDEDLLEGCISLTRIDYEGASDAVRWAVETFYQHSDTFSVVRITQNNNYSSTASSIIQL